MYITAAKYVHYMPPNDFEDIITQLLYAYCNPDGSMQPGAPTAELRRCMSFLVGGWCSHRWLGVASHTSIACLHCLQTILIAYTAYNWRFKAVAVPWKLCRMMTHQLPIM